MAVSLHNIALSGLRAAARRLAASGHNIANVSTDGFVPRDVVQSENAGGGVTATEVERAGGAADPFTGVDLAEELVTQRSALLEYRANIAVLKTDDQATGALLNLLA